VGIVLIVIAGAFFVAAIVVLYIAVRRPKQPRQPGGRQDPLKSDVPQEFGPRQLGPGAIISYGGVDYVVRGSVTLREGPFVWWEHLLEGGKEPLWFSVEEDDGRLKLAMWVARKDLVLQQSTEQVVDGVAVRESERGHASYTCEGETGLPPAGQMDFVDYASADEAVMLSFERYAPDMPWELSSGRSLSPGELTVYPAPTPSA
jgi:hypothetical protein